MIVEITEDTFEKVYEMAVGDVVHYEGNYETIARRIEENMPDGMAFETFPITPGTTPFSMYGCNCIMITRCEKVS